MGVVVAPAIDKTWWGAPVGDGAMMRPARTRAPIAVRAATPGKLVAVASVRTASRDRSLPGPGRVIDRTSAGSSLKFCLVAEGKADVYPRFGRTMEWDVAAGHAVLSAAGGRVTTRDGAPFHYRKPGFENPAFIARGA